MQGLKWLGGVILVVIILIGLLHMFGLDIELEESFRGRRRRGHSRRRWKPGWRRGWYRGGWWPITWWGAGTPLVAYAGSCPSGCMNVGRGIWGCPIPGNSFGDCQFASDCQYCDRGWFW